MQIILDSLFEFHDGGIKFTLPSKLYRFIEFEDVVVFLLDDSGVRSKIVGIKLSTNESICCFYIAWEFQIIDGLGEIHEIDYLMKEIYKGQEVVHCHGWRFDIEFYLDPSTGEIIDKVPAKW
jgi:hypothetical protein